MIEFEWDQKKAKSNEKKHGISFSEACTIFGDPLELTIEDPKHSSGEYRFLSIGKSNSKATAQRSEQFKNKAFSHGKWEHIY